jgi:hypothetical protein
VRMSKRIRHFELQDPPFPGDIRMHATG